MRKRILFVLAGCAAAYLLTYAGFRATHTEVWERDGRAYVIFPEKMVALYYVFRPMSYIDGAVTGIGFHIGPHR